LSGKKSLLTAEEAMKVKQEFSKNMQGGAGGKGQGRRRKKTAKKALPFWKRTKMNKAVITHGVRLQYTSSRSGTGPKPKASDMVTVHYRGTPD